MRVDSPEINADLGDPHDLNFAYTGKLIAIRLGSGTVKWTRVYLPTMACRDWDNPPADVNIATGVRFGWIYASLRMTGKKPVRVPGGGYAVGVKGKITQYTHSFNHGWEADEPLDCWVVVSTDQR